MSSERRQVLEMLASGKISAEDAERLLEKLGSAAESDPPAGQSSKAGRPKYLRVLVDSTTGDKVNIRVPLSLVRTGIKLSSMLPSEADERLKARGIDLSGLSGLEDEEMIEALRELTVNVDAHGGDKVRIFCD